MNEPIELLSPKEVESMRVVCRLAADLLAYVGGLVKAGVSTEELNQAAEEYTRRHKAQSAPLGYHGYPKSICTSVNEVVCHGIPSKTCILKDGDIINIDVSPKLNGFYGDTSKMYFVGAPKPVAKKLVCATEECLRLGIREVAPDKRVGDIGAAIQEYAESQGFSVVRDFVGHAIGKVFHGPLQIPHFGKRGTGRRLQEGMIFTIEPMINEGRSEVEILADKWTAVTKDRKLSAQFEHTVLVTKTGVEVLTLREGEVYIF